MKQLVFAALLVVAACGRAPDPTAGASTAAIAGAAAAPVAPDAPAMARTAAPTRTDLKGRMDCLRDHGGIVVIGHRGGPTRDYPPNALESLKRTFHAGTHGMEIDVARSSDGRLYLMHDDTLERSTTGSGTTDGLKWADIQKLQLKTGRKTTDFHPASLEAVLDWAVSAGALVELDRKSSVSIASVVDAVRRVHAENSVLMVTYTDAQAEAVHHADPGLFIAATIHSASQLDRLLSHGLPADRLVAWTGDERPDPELWKALRAKGVLSAFGTLGPRGKSLDSAYWSDGDGSEYTDLAAEGLAFVVTDLSDKVSRQLAPEMKQAESCGF
ncbi:MAG: glycerophosphodiester phosphodiesterase [Alphaproteobacteria bacterium]|nr:glycerophosphodiester phosphodiesterase [Alphaproteobacteria bacterium]